MLNFNFTAGLLLVSMTLTLQHSCHSVNEVTMTEKERK